MAERQISVWPDGEWRDTGREPRWKSDDFKVFTLDYDPHSLEDEDDYVNGYVKALVDTRQV